MIELERWASGSNLHSKILTRAPDCIPCLVEEELVLSKMVIFYPQSVMRNHDEKYTDYQVWTWRRMISPGGGAGRLEEMLAGWLGWVGGLHWKVGHVISRWVLRGWSFLCRVHFAKLVTSRPLPITEDSLLKNKRDQELCKFTFTGLSG